MRIPDSQEFFRAVAGQNLNLAQGCLPSQVHTPGRTPAIKAKLMHPDTSKSSPTLVREVRRPRLVVFAHLALLRTASSGPWLGMSTPPQVRIPNSPRLGPPSRMVLCMGSILHLCTQWTLRLAPESCQNFRAVPPKPAIAKSSTPNPGVPHPRARSALLVSQIIAARTTKGSRVGTGRFTLLPAPGVFRRFRACREIHARHVSPGVRRRCPHKTTSQHQWGQC